MWVGCWWAQQLPSSSTPSLGSTWLCLCCPEGGSIAPPPVVLHAAQVGGSPCFTQAPSCPHSHPREEVKLREERAGRTDLPSLGECETLPYLSTAIPLHPTEEEQIHLPWNERTNTFFFQAPGPTVNSCNVLRAHSLLRTASSSIPVTLWAPWAVGLSASPDPEIVRWGW